MNKTLHEHHYLLFQFRVLRSLGYIGIDSVIQTPVGIYIFNNILTTPLAKLLTAKQLNSEDAATINRANKEALYRSLI